ncbi:MAG: monooxygenase, partial [Actinomycetes bacterium]
PIVNQQLVYYVGHGDITPVGDIARFEADRVVFADGRSAEADLVVFCTGYLVAFPFLPDAQELLNWQGDHPRLALQIFTPTSPSLFVSGLIQPDSGQWTLAHWQGMTIARYIEAQRTDPVRAERFRREVLAEAGRTFSGGAEYKDSSRHYYEVAHQEYLARLEGAVHRLEAA